MTTRSEAAARRAERRRQTWKAQVFRSDQAQAMEDAERSFWLEIPPDERAAVVWQLSVEMFGIANGQNVERRLPRSAYRVVRR